MQTDECLLVESPHPGVKEGGAWTTISIAEQTEGVGGTEDTRGFIHIHRGRFRWLEQRRAASRGAAVSGAVGGGGGGGCGGTL